MTVALEVLVEAESVEVVLARLDAAVSPEGLYYFLAGEVAPWIKSRAEKRFASEGDDVSGKWEELAPSTQDRRMNGDWPVGPAHPINVRTGELRDYIVGSDPLIVASEVVSTLTYPGNEPRTRSLTEKMTTAQVGRTTPRTSPRPVIGISETDLAYVMGALATHIRGAVQL